MKILVRNDVMMLVEWIQRASQRLQLCEKDKLTKMCLTTNHAIRIKLTLKNLWPSKWGAFFSFACPLARRHHPWFWGLHSHFSISIFTTLRSLYGLFFYIIPFFPLIIIITWIRATFFSASILIIHILEVVVDTGVNISVMHASKSSFH